MWYTLITSIHTKLTWTYSKWRTFKIVVQNIVYTPYLAECRMESNLPSPLQATFFIFFILSIRLAWYLSQYRRTAGSRKDLWCQKKVQPEYPQSSIWRNTSKTLLIDAPATKTPKLNRILPAGNFPRQLVVISKSTLGDIVNKSESLWQGFHTASF